MSCDKPDCEHTIIAVEINTLMKEPIVLDHQHTSYGQLMLNLLCSNQVFIRNRLITLCCSRSVSPHIDIDGWFTPILDQMFHTEIFILFLLIKLIFI